MEVRRWSDGVEVRRGAKWTRRPSDWPRLDIEIECVGVDPERYVGRVRLDEVTVLESDPVPDFGQADNLVRTQLRRRIIELLS